MKEKVAARAKKSAARASATGARGRKPTKRDEVSREFAQTSPAHIQRVQEGNSGERDVDSAITRTLTTATRRGGFQLSTARDGAEQCQLCVRLCHRLMGMHSPSKLLEVSFTEARRQFDSFNAQTRQLAALAQELGRHSRPSYDPRGKRICHGDLIRKAGLISRRRRGWWRVPSSSA